MHRCFLLHSPPEHIKGIFLFSKRTVQLAVEPGGWVVRSAEAERVDAHHEGKSTTSQSPTAALNIMTEKGRERGREKQEYRPEAGNFQLHLTFSSPEDLNRRAPLGGITSCWG